MRHRLDMRAIARGLGLSVILAGLSPAGLHAATPVTALVIGSDANAGQPECEKVAGAVGNRRQGLGFTVRLLLRPTAIALRSALDDFAVDQQSRPPGPALIYACAGAVGDGPRLFLLPSNPEAGQPPQPRTQGVVLQALLNALTGTGGTLYADLGLPKGSASSGFSERLPDGLHLALAVSGGGNPAAIGKHLTDPSARIDQAWPEIAEALKPLTDATALTVLPLPAAPPAVVAASPPVTLDPTPAASPPPVPDRAEPPAPEAAAIAPPADLPTPPPAAAPAPSPGPAPSAKSAPPAVAQGRGAGNDTAPASARTVRIQTALAGRHIYPGPIDGLMGPNTIRAIRSFQGSLGSAPTGVLTPPEIIRLLNP